MSLTAVTGWFPFPLLPEHLPRLVAEEKLQDLRPATHCCRIDVHASLTSASGLTITRQDMHGRRAEVPNERTTNLAGALMMQRGKSDTIRQRPEALRPTISSWARRSARGVVRRGTPGLPAGATFSSASRANVGASTSTSAINFAIRHYERKFSLCRPRGSDQEGACRATKRAYVVGVGTTLFDRMVQDGRVPKPARIDGRVLWDRVKLDRALDRLFDSGNDMEIEDPYAEVQT